MEPFTFTKAMMEKINKITNKIYDPKIEKPEYQTLMRSCIKAWIREGIENGIKLGRQELALELEMTFKKIHSAKGGYNERDEATPNG